MATPRPKPTATKRGAVFVMPDGSTVGQKDLGKVKPTPKPKVTATKKPEKMTPQDAASKKIIKKRYGW